MQKIPTYLIMEDDAIIHLGKEITDMITLTDRIHQYLREQGDGTWVTKEILAKKATEKSFSNAQIQEAFRAIEDISDIGKIYDKGVTQYCWYNIPTQQQERIKRAQELWATL